MPTRIWLNRNYATSFHLAGALRANPDGESVDLYGSHVDPCAPLLTTVDHVLPEPAADVRFADCALELCQQHQIEVFLPVAGQLAVAERLVDFRAAGVAVIAPPAQAIAVLADKAATYTALAGLPLVPPWRSVHTPMDFDAALAELHGAWTSDAPLVVKPARGVGADGVRFLRRERMTLAELLGPVGLDVQVHEFRAAVERSPAVPDLLVMPYLPGPETSVDILARAGRVEAAVPRTKIGRLRVIDAPPEIMTAAAELVERFALDGLVNVQFRWFSGRPALLEINTRPSGGLHQTRLAGVNLIWSAVRQALGRPAAPGSVRLGARYVTVSAVAPCPAPVLPS